MLDMEAYQTYKHKDRAARILMLTNMRNDIMLCFERHHLAQFVWDTVKIQYGETFTTRLCQLTLKFNSYKKRQNQTMRQHLTVMANVISELRGVGHEMTDEQQVQAVIRFLPSNWEHIRVNLTYNDNIKIFDDVAHRVELKEDRFHVEKHVNKAFISEIKMRRAYDSKYKKVKGKGPKYGKRGIEASNSGHKSKCEKRDGKKGKNINCFNCGKPGHFARDYTEAKVMFNYNHPSNLYFSSCLMLVEFVPL
jgi:hypothetical protein